MEYDNAELADISDIPDSTLEVPDEKTEVNQSEHDPNFEIPPLAPPTRCSTCANEISPSTSVDGECFSCALKRMREIEKRLVQVGKVQETRKYCPIPGHREAQKTPLFPEWDGVIVINGVKLQPVFPLCRDCINQLTAYLVFFLEQRGIMRKGNKDVKNDFGEPLKTPMTAAEEYEASQRLKEFMSVVNLYAMDNKSPLNGVYKTIVERRMQLLRTRVKEAKKCLDAEKMTSKELRVKQDANLLKNRGAEAARTLLPRQTQAALSFLLDHPKIARKSIHEIEELSPSDWKKIGEDLRVLPSLEEWSVDSVVDLSQKIILPTLQALSYMEGSETDS